MHFALANNGHEHQITISPGEVAYLGRGNRCAVVVDNQSVSTTHVELSVAHAAGSSSLLLFAKDKSQNGTGILDSVEKSRAEADVRSLSRERAEELRDGAALVVPLRKRGLQGSDLVDQQSIFAVRLFGAIAAMPPVPLETPFSPAPRLSAAASSTFSSTPNAYDPATGSGRWRYGQKLGEGGLAVVYRAEDVTGSLGEVAVKVLKHPERPFWGKQYAFAMHREAQWSLQRIHNESDPRFRPELAKIFVRYLEDHTGYAQLAPLDFDARRRKYEVSDFNWERDGPPLPHTPYVVMELVRGEGVNPLIDRERRRVGVGAREEPPLSSLEKRDLLAQAAQALEYLCSFNLIHRDFRGCNMHVSERLPGKLSLKVLDLGVMISAEDGQQWNTNQAVQAFKCRGDTEEKKRRYDWLPWEVRAGADGQAPAVNFMEPSSSFDMFSFGVLVLHLLLGRSEARAALEKLRTGGKMPDTCSLGVDPELVHRMFAYESSRRPKPEEVVRAFKNGRSLHARKAAAPRSSRSRSRNRPGRPEADPAGIFPEDGEDEELAFQDYRGPREARGQAQALGGTALPPSAPGGSPSSLKEEPSPPVPASCTRAMPLGTSVLSAGGDGHSEFGEEDMVLNFGRGDVDENVEMQLQAISVSILGGCVAGDSVPEDAVAESTASSVALPELPPGEAECWQLCFRVQPPPPP